MADNNDTRKPADAANNAAKGPSMEEFRALQEQLRATSETLKVLADQNAALQKQAGTTLPEEDRPIYELSQPWYSPDDIYYPEGVQIVDVRGDIPPNEFMIPLNEPARERYEQYMADLPTPGRQPSISEMIEATAKAIRHLGPNASGEQVAAMVAHALTTARDGAARRPTMNEPATRLSLTSTVPLMPNTKITGAAGAARPSVARTRQVGQAAPATAPLLGAVHTPPLASLPV